VLGCCRPTVTTATFTSGRETQKTTIIQVNMVAVITLRVATFKKTFKKSRRRWR
jgi:hypothetical protein